MTALGRFQHPNIVTLYGVVYHTDGSNAVSIVEELAERDLCDAVGDLAASGKTLPLVWQLKYGLDVARAVAYMHANRVSHCGAFSPCRPKKRPAARAPC